MQHRFRKKSKPRQKAKSNKVVDALFMKIWRTVDGKVRETFKAHPEYTQKKYRYNTRVSIVKRVTGDIHALLREEYIVKKRVSCKGKGEST